MYDIAEINKLNNVNTSQPSVKWSTSKFENPHTLHTLSISWMHSKSFPLSLCAGATLFRLCLHRSVHIWDVDKGKAMFGNKNHQLPPEALRNLAQMKIGHFSLHTARPNHTPQGFTSHNHLLFFSCRWWIWDWSCTRALISGTCGTSLTL